MNRKIAWIVGPDRIRNKQIAEQLACVGIPVFLVYHIGSREARRRTQVPESYCVESLQGVSLDSWRNIAGGNKDEVFSLYVTSHQEGSDLEVNTQFESYWPRTQKYVEKFTRHFTTSFGGLDDFLRNLEYQTIKKPELVSAGAE